MALQLEYILPLPLGLLLRSMPVSSSCFTMASMISAQEPRCLWSFCCACHLPVVCELFPQADKALCGIIPAIFYLPLPPAHAPGPVVAWLFLDEQSPVVSVFLLGGGVLCAGLQQPLWTHSSLASFWGRHSSCERTVSWGTKAPFLVKLYVNWVLVKTWELSSGILF